MASSLELRAMIEWWVASRPMPGQEVCGDDYVVHQTDKATLLAVIDGLGHGPEAAEASSSAALYIVSHHDQPLDRMVVGCHQSLLRTRGVVLGVAHVDHHSGCLTWLAVGNIDGRVVRGPLGVGGGEALLQRGGVVGYQLPQLQTRTVDLTSGDLLILATDGIDNQYAEDLKVGAVHLRAARLLADHARSNDDALILVARYTGNGS